MNIHEKVEAWTRTGTNDTIERMFVYEVIIWAGSWRMSQCEPSKVRLEEHSKYGEQKEQRQEMGKWTEYSESVWMSIQVWPDCYCCVCMCVCKWVRNDRLRQQEKVYIAWPNTVPLLLEIERSRQKLGWDHKKPWEARGGSPMFPAKA